MGGLLTTGQLLLSGSFLTFLLGLYVGYKWLPSFLSKTPAPVKAALAALEEDLTAHMDAEVLYVAAKLRASLGLVAAPTNPYTTQAPPPVVSVPTQAPPAA